MPTAEDVLNFFRRNAGLGEDPPGSNHNWITEWFGFDGAWCAMSIMRALVEAGFTDDGDTVVVPGVALGSRHGPGYVPALAAYFANAGRLGSEPRVGALIIWRWPSSGDWVDPTYGYPGDHTSVLEAALDDGSIVSWDGNSDDEIGQRRRSSGLVYAYCYPPYDDIGVVEVGPPVVEPEPEPEPEPVPPPPPPEDDEMPAVMSYAIDPGEEVQIALPAMFTTPRLGKRFMSFFTSHAGPNDHAHVLIHLWGQSDPFGKDILPGNARNGVPVWDNCEGIGLYNDGNVQVAVLVVIDKAG